MIPNPSYFYDSVISFYKITSSDYLKLKENFSFYSRMTTYYDIPITEIDKYQDFTIILSDGTEIKTFKDFLINKVEYFNILSKDGMMDGDSLNINDDPLLIRVLFHIIHFNSIDQITNNNLYDVIFIMDKYLMKYNINILWFIQLNIIDMINNYINNNEIDKIVLLYDLFVNLTNLCKNHNIMSDYINHINKIVKSFIKIINFRIENIFIFKDWANIFTPSNKINSIKKYKRYDLLNVSNLSTRDTLAILNIKFNIVILSSLGNVYFIKNIGEKLKPYYTHTINHIITSYHPTINYISLYYKDINVISINNNIITIETNHSSILNQKYIVFNDDYYVENYKKENLFIIKTHSEVDEILGIKVKKLTLNNNIENLIPGKHFITIYDKHFM